jgi:hypothetical protein
MQKPSQCKPILRCLLLCALLSFGHGRTQAESGPLVAETPPSPLTAEEVIRNLVAKDQQRARALGAFQGTRTYRMQYRGFPSDREAEMVVTVKASYKSPATKEFTVVSQSGSKFILDHVFRKLLEGEQEALRQENRDQTALNPANYDFTLDRYELTPAGAQYVLSVFPRSKNKFLYRGKIWVDAKDFAVVRIEAEPARAPSFWIKKSEIEHTYVKVNDFWLPAENHTETQVRLGGRAILSIEYKDYSITRADPIPQVETTPGGADTSLVREAH